MTYIFFSILAAATGFLRPLWGFGIFFLANSGAVGFFEKMGILGGQLGPFRPENMAYISAIAGLLLRKKGKAASFLRGGAIEIFLWIITIMILLSRTLETNSMIIIIKTGAYCLLWAPLFVALQKLDPSERLKFHKLIIAFSTLTAFLTVLTVVSGSNYLYQILSIYRFGQVQEIKPDEFIMARVTLPGLWSLTYLGFWFSIKELIGQKKSRVATFLYSGALAFMILAFLFNMTRTIIMGIASGLFIVVVLGMLFLTKIKRSRIFLLSAFIFITTFYALQHFEGLSTGYQERFGQVTEALSAKIDKNEYMLGILTDELPLIGHKDDNRASFVPGDPHTFVRIWWDYGLIVSLSLVAIFFIAFLKLLKIIRWHKKYAREILTTTLCLIAFWLQFQFEMMSGYYLFPEPLFVFTVFLAEIVYISRSKLSQPVPVSEQYGTGKINFSPRRRITW